MRLALGEGKSTLEILSNAPMEGQIAKKLQIVLIFCLPNGYTDIEVVAQSIG